MQEIGEQKGGRLDPDYYRAKDCLIDMLDELRHNSNPTLEAFMENIDFMLDHPNLINQAKQNLEAARKEAERKK